MATAIDIIAARLHQTGMQTDVATRLATLIGRDLYRSGYGVVENTKVELLAQELTRLNRELTILADAWMRMERQGKLPKEM